MWSFLNLIVVCVLYTEAAKKDERLQQYGQNLQHIETTIIDVPDDAPWPTESSGYNLWNPRWSRAPGDVNQNVALHQSIPRQNNILPVVKTGDRSRNISLQNYPYPYNYHGAAYNTPYIQNYNTPYVYRPFYPQTYIRRYYPLLHQQFPNGFYVLPESDNIFATTKAPTAIKQTSNAATVTNLNNHGNNFGVTVPKDNTIPNQSDTLQISNSTTIAEKRTFVSKIELMPVSTKFVRYNGPDGKTYLKVTSSDSEGQEIVTESIHTGNIDLKILNGVLERPNNPKSALSSKQVEVDPNSIVVQPREGNREKETGEPDDITSWIY